MRRACIDEIRRFVATGDYDMVFPVWPGGHALERMHAGDAALRAALADALHQRTKGLTFPSMPSSFDPGQFVLGKVRPMVCGLFPAKERQVMLDLFEKALVFVSGDNIESLISETDSLSTAHQIANLFLGSLGLPGLDDQPVGFVGFSEETTFYVSMAYFKDGDPFADWVVHEAAHVFHNWKRAYVGLPQIGTHEFLLNISFAKREVFAYACEAYSRILERAKCPADRRRLYAEYVEKWVPHCDFKKDINLAMKAAYGDDFEELVFPPAADQRIQLRVRWKSLKREQTAADLSDGTLRFLFLLTVLASPSPAALVAIDEPETGLHPAMLPIVAEYAVDASSRTQVILTTHSPQLLDAFTDVQPVTTVVKWCDGETVLEKLDGEKLDRWLEEYSLGNLFRSGELESGLEDIFDHAKVAEPRAPYGEIPEVRI